jgi:tRNA(Ile)-lysidine synthase
VARQEEENIKFDIKRLKLPNYKSYLYQWLNEFVRLGAIYDLVESQLENKFSQRNIAYLKIEIFLIVAPLDL